MECYICKQDQRISDKNTKICEYEHCNNKVEQFKRFCSTCSIQHNICERCGVNLKASVNKQEEARRKAFEGGRKYSNFLRLSMEENIREYTKQGNLEMATYCQRLLKGMNKRAEQRLKEYKYSRKET